MINNKITILYDNSLYNKNLKSGWGFSCLITYKGKVILFDTGADFNTLIYNIKHLNINSKTIIAIVISHMHYDHTGGLVEFLNYNRNNNKNVSIFLPSSATKQDITVMLSYGIFYQNIKIVNNSQKIMDNIYSTGSLGIFIKEQSLVINTRKGLIIVTGCAHPGIVHIIEKSVNLFRNAPLLVIGGFHLFSKSTAEIQKIIKQFKRLEVKYVTPCHCSGDNAITLFKKDYGSYYIEGGVGRTINIENLT